MDRDVYVQALLREREGYALRGRENRVAHVDAELERLGEKVPPAGDAPETTKASPPLERATPQRPQRADR